MSYGVLSSREMLETLYRLKNRINERFPNSGLFKISEQVVEIVKEAQDRSRWLTRELMVVRIFTLVLAVLIPAVIVAAFVELNLSVRLFSAGDILNSVQTIILYVVFFWAVFSFLIHVEKKKKRLKVIKAFHRIRHLAHLVDLYQLEKDSSRAATDGKDTPSSPSRLKDTFLVGRYRWYCKALLTVLSKVPPLYSQHFDEPQVLTLASEVEMLCVALRD